MHFIADTDTDEYLLFWIYFSVADAETAVPCSLEGAA